MRSISRSERKLRRGIEAMICKANWKYYGRLPYKDEDKYLRHRDEELLGRLALQIADEVDYHKKAEKYLMENLEAKKFRFEATTDGESFEYSILGGL